MSRHSHPLLEIYCLNYLNSLNHSRMNQPDMHSLGPARKFRAAHKESFHRSRFADQCAVLGYRTLLEWSVDCGAPLDHETANKAAQHGNIEMLKLYLRKKHHVDVAVQLTEDMHGDLNAVTKDLQEWACRAAFAGCQETLMWLFSETYIKPYVICLKPTRIIMEAARGGHVELVSWLSQRSRPPVSEDSREAFSLCVNAAKGGHLEAFKQFYQGFVQAGFDENLFGIPKFSFILNLRESFDHPKVMSWCLAHNHALLDQGKRSQLEIEVLSSGQVDEMKDYLKGWLEVMKNLYQHNRADFSERLKHVHFRVIPWLLEELGIERFEEVDVHLLHPAIDMQAIAWMEKHGLELRYFFDEFIEKQLELGESNIEQFLKWMLRKNLRINSQCIWRIAKQIVFYGLPIDLLDRLWQLKADTLEIDGETIPTILSYFCNYFRPTDITGSVFRTITTILPTLKTIQWLRQKGYHYGQKDARDYERNLDRSVYDLFVLTLIKKKPRFVKDYLDEIQKLEFPFSPDVFLSLQKFRDA